MLNFEDEFIDVDEVDYYHTISNIFYMLAPITGGITLFPAYIVDAKLSKILHDDIEDEISPVTRGWRWILDQIDKRKIEK